MPLPLPLAYLLAPASETTNQAHCLWLSWILLHLPEQHSLPLLQWVPFFSQQRPFLHCLPRRQGQLPSQGLFALPV